jgi:hypothetical protein
MMQSWRETWDHDVNLFYLLIIIPCILAIAMALHVIIVTNFPTFVLGFIIIPAVMCCFNYFVFTTLGFENLVLIAFIEIVAIIYIMAFIDKYRKEKKELAKRFCLSRKDPLIVDAFKHLSSHGRGTIRSKTHLKELIKRKKAHDEQQEDIRNERKLFNLREDLEGKWVMRPLGRSWIRVRMHN